MASKKIYDAVATAGEYKKDGETKRRYINVGSVFQNDEGQLSLKLDTIPVGQEWNGWISFYAPKPNGDRRESTPAPKRESAPVVDIDDDIPF